MKRHKKGLIFILMLALCAGIFASITWSSPCKTFNDTYHPLEIRLAAKEKYEEDFYKTWGGSDEDGAQNIALDGSGNIYIAGATESYGAGGYDAFIAKYDSSGDFLWDTIWGGSGNDYGYSIELDGSGNIYITGITFSFDVGNGDAFIAKFDSYGNSLLNITWGDSGVDFGRDIALDGLGNIYITGEGGSDAFIAKFNSTGDLKKNSTWGGSDDDNGYSIALDGSDNIYITGETESFGAVDWNAFIAKFNNSVDLQWATIWDAGDSDRGYGIALDNSRNIYITGRTYSFGNGDADSFIVKFDSTGTSLWETTWGKWANDWGLDIALDDSGNIYITGRTDSTVSYYNIDAFIAKFDSSGNLQGDGTWGGSDTEGGIGIALDVSGDIYIAGATESYGAGDYDTFILKWTTSSVPDDISELFSIIIIIIIIASVAAIGAIGGIVCVKRYKKKKHGYIRKHSKNTFKPEKKVIKRINSEPYNSINSSMMSEKSHLSEGQRPYSPPKGPKIGVYCASCHASHSITREQFEMFSCGRCGHHFFNIGYFCRNCNQIYPISKVDFIKLQETETLLCYECNNVMELSRSDQ